MKKNARNAINVASRHATGGSKETAVDASSARIPLLPSSGFGYLWFPFPPHLHIKNADVRRLWRPAALRLLPAPLSHRQTRVFSL